MRLPVLLTCIFLFSGFDSFSQSLYQDAKALKTMMEASGKNKKEGDLWFELTQLESLPYLFVNSDRIYGTSFFQENNPENSIPPGDYVLRNSGLENKILVRNKSKHSLLYETDLGEGEVIRIEENRGKGKISIFYQDKKLESFEGFEMAESYITTRFYNDYEHAPDPYLLLVSEANTTRANRMTGNHLTLDHLGYYYFHDLPLNDTLQLKVSGQTVFTIYTIGDIRSDGEDYQYVRVDASGKIDISSRASPFYIRNQYERISVTFDSSNEPFFSAEKKHPNTPVELALIPETDSYAQYAIHPAQALNLNNYKPAELLVKRMKLDTMTYHFWLSSDSSRISFYRDSELIRSTEFAGNVIFSYLRNKQAIEVFTDQFSDPFAGQPRMTSQIRKSYTFPLSDALELKGLKLVYKRAVEDTLISDTGVFDFFRCNGKQAACVWDSIPAQPLLEDGLYQARFNPKWAMETALLDIKYLQPLFFYKNGKAYTPPLECNLPVDNGFEFLIHDKSLTFYYPPALQEEKRVIYLHKKDFFPSLLATHAQVKKSDIPTSNIWGAVSAKYRNNPFLGAILKNDLAQSIFEDPPGMSNDTLARRVSRITATLYPWQKVLFENGRLETEQAVSYEDVVNTYRTPITTASDNLRAASEQFGSESKKLKRSVSTADLVAGLSDFIVERAQEELNVTFLSRLREGILSDTAEFSLLFPETRKMLLEFRIVQYRTLLDFAKNAFVVDLRNLGFNFPKLFSRVKKYERIKNDPKVYNIFLLYDIANKVYEGMPIDTVLLHIHTRLQERRSDLGKSINREMARVVEKDPSIAGFVTAYQSQLKEFEKAQAALIATDIFWWETLFRDTASRRVARHLYPEWKIDTSTREYVLAGKNLQGEVDYEYVLEKLPFNAHKAFFSEEVKPLEIISTGIDLTQTLLDSEIAARHHAKLQEIESNLASIGALQRTLEAEEAQRTLQLSNYIPFLEQFSALMAERAAINLALSSEIALDKKSHYLKDRDHQSLVYFQKVMEKPEQYQLFDWTALDRFNSKLKQASMDTCISRPDATRQFRMTVCGLLSGKPLDAYNERLKLAVVMDSIGYIQSEMENARVFMSKMAGAIKDQFKKIAKDPIKQGIRIMEPADTVYYNRFLFSREMTAGTLALNYESLMEKMNAIIQADSVSGKANFLPELEGYASERWNQADVQLKVARYNAARASAAPVPDPVGNAFLDQYDYDQTIKFSPETITAFADSMTQTLVALIEKTRSSIAVLDRISAQCKARLNDIQRESAGDLVLSLRQTDDFALLTEITLQWLYAFQDGGLKQDSVVIQDSIIQHIREETPDKKVITYDKLQVVALKTDSEQPVRRWITPQKFNSIMEDTLLRKAYLGLLYQRLNAIQGGPKYTAANMALLATKFMNTIYDIDDRRELLKDKKRNNQTLGFEDYYPFIKSTVDMLNVVLETPVEANGQPLSQRFASLKDVPVVSNEVLSLFENVFAENYASAIRNVVQLLSITWGLNDSGFEYRVKRDENNAENMRPDRKLKRQNKRIKSGILMYGSFMANVVGAQTPGQVKAAIHAVALPAGGSSLKRNSKFNVSVNSYLGAGFHFEKLNADNISNPWAPSYGLSVPIGVAASWGSLLKKSKWSCSIFVPILDIGAVTSYRIDQQAQETPFPDLSLKNFIAPGGYFMVNFPKSPFTVGAGIQFGPQARKITEGMVEKRSGAFRAGIIATFDLPFFNIFTSSR